MRLRTAAPCLYAIIPYMCIRDFVKGWQPGKLTGCQLDHAWLLLLPNQVVFLQESVNIDNLCPPVKTEYPPVQNLNEAPVYIQLFRERLSVKTYATIPKGFMGNGCLPLSDRISRCFSPREGESMKIRTHVISLYRAKATRTSIKQQQLTLPIKPFGIGVCAFYRQPFSKQLYIHVSDDCFLFYIGNVYIYFTGRKLLLNSK